MILDYARFKKFMTTYYDKNAGRYLIPYKQITKLAKAYAGKGHEWGALDKKLFTVINTAKYKTAALRYAKEHGNAYLYNMATHVLTEVT